ncbi:MAG: ferritin-like domain-containing protein [Solirubrobacteraceae bacterium]
MLAGGAALAAPAPATPQGDDVGFLTFGVVAERTALAFYKKALRTPKQFDAAERRRLTQARTAKREHVTRINAALGADAVGSADYEVDFPKSAFASHDSALALGQSLEELLVGVYVNGAGYAADPGTRLLIARMLTVDGQILGTLRAMAGRPAAGGLPTPLDTEQAGDVLDRLIIVPGSPGGG